MTKEEAIKIARNISKTDEEREALEMLVPELKESEDERARKEIIAFLQSMNGYCNPTQDWDLRNRWLPYLKKQKDSLHIAETYKENSESFTDDELDKLKKRAIKNHNIAIEETNKCCAAAIDGCKIERQKEQQPAEWSEEDKKRIQRICDFLWKNRKGDTDTIYQIEKDTEWLKSLRPSWKPSEEPKHFQHFDPDC